MARDTQHRPKREGEPLGNGQSQPTTFDPAPPRFRRTKEGRKHVGKVRFSYTTAVVFHLHAHRFLFLAKSNRDRCSWLTILASILDQDIHQLAKQGGLHQDKETTVV